MDSLGRPKDEILSGMPDEEWYAWMNKPLDREAVTMLHGALRDFPEVRLYAIDKTAEDPGPCSIILGDNETVQVQVDKDRLALIFKPGRFTLAPECAGELKRRMKEKAMQALKGVEKITAWSGKSAKLAVAASESSESEGKIRFENALRDAVRNGRLKEMSARSKSVTMECDRKEVAELWKLAAKARFDYTRPAGKGSATGHVAGDEVARSVRYVLENMGRHELVRDLIRWDREKVGAYEIKFDESAGTITFLTKEKNTFTVKR